MYYRLGWPLGHFLAKAGVPTLIRVNVIRDDDAAVFVGTSHDVPGLVLETSTLEEMLSEINATVPELLNCRERILRHDPIASIRVFEHLAHA